MNHQHSPYSTAAWRIAAVLAVTATAIAPLATAPVAAQPKSRTMSAPAAKIHEQDEADQALPPDPDFDRPDGPAIAGPELSEGAFYGPPAPKARKGELPSIGWNEANGHVPPALDEAIRLVTANYPSAKSARSALRAAASDVKAAKWLRFPSISGDIAYLSDESRPEPQLSIDQPLWSGGRIDSNIRRAKAAEDASSAQYIEIVRDLAISTSQTYFEVARLTQREQLLEESKFEHGRLVETMERRVAQEISPIADLELARSRLAQIEQEYTITQSQRRTALRVLAELIADPNYDLGPMPYYDPSIELPNRAVLEDQAVAYDPTLQRLFAETEVARADLDSRRASILPQVSAQYTYSEFLGSRVGVILRAQSSGGLSQFSEVRSARLRIEAAQEDVRVAEQQLRRDIETTIIQYRAARERAEISKSAASTAARVSASYTRQFIAGRRSWLDVMNALREAINAEIGRSDAEVTVMSSATQLLLLSGRWRPVFSEDGEPDNF